ncbi:MAG: hypothetical protein A2499_04995 [Stygiobacter sp. RIFOXYC12_FULL_38_8]|nr:MAG: hypothetical protein A2299_16365 [Stygiobacter sp. RIFOXYB2_FULL_37_11]OGV13482.1 MAG: hypothetical protein A2237_17060 [Stygiobacter sp. RIFOXYA2_FULL_38_8]OGV14773.1 MAG: hypothetical protein A2440_09745 [Stygiobacter sp. RIFOXYC2_FULL_38_25]OGV22308.1 MAG: hypothetical protein A2499_04995 [Stygiobacter sp. RIFOXYC12_FULL_38_8]OGV79266.1 MAG: hypothetical protein A2X65_02115 [Stygiobacter sp. GWF2_38_21]
MKILFGTSAPSLEVQLKGKNIDSLMLGILEKDNSAIDRLSERKYITDRQMKAARKLLLKRIQIQLEP